ncbi:hypothetical protein N510_000750 [Firmicutes bacterium ASF500]|nr:hypothetical protein N510_000750 [Firmicutes bacterium ASF500]
MKKLFTLIVVFAMTLSLAACGGPAEPPQSSAGSKPPAGSGASSSGQSTPGTFYAREHRAEILAGIDEVIASLNAGSISYDEAISKIQETIPKPESSPDYPNRDITVVIGWGEGGSSDKYPRNIGVDAAKILGVNLVYLNMAGSNGDLAVAYTLESDPDGYTICGINGSQPTTQIFYEHDYVFTEDMAFITANQSYAEGLFVKAGSGLETWEDVVAYAQEHGNINIATVGETNDDGLVVWALQDFFKMKMTNIGYTKAGERTTALMGGHVELLADSVGNVMQLVESGDVIPVLYYGDIHYDFAPDVPSFSDYGLEMSLYRYRGFGGPKDLADDICEYLYQVFYAAQWLPNYQEFEATEFLNYSQPFTLAPEELKEFVQSFYEEGLDMYNKYYKNK